MAKRKILTLTIALGVASMLALIIGLASSAGGGGKVQAGGGLSERSRHRECSAATLQGDYLFSATGYNRSDLPDPTLPDVAVGLRTFDGAGNLSQAFSSSHGGQIARGRGEMGTYTLDSDCTGTMTIAGTRHWDIFVAGDGGEGAGVGTTEGRIVSQTFRRGNREKN